MDLSEDGRPRGDLEQVGRVLRELPCTTAALAPETPRSRVASLLEHFDVVVSTAGELARVSEAVARSPLAALALVQLLRGGSERDVHEGLVAESLVYSTLQSGPQFRAWLAARAPRPPRPMPPEPAVRVERFEGRLELALNRPEKRNAFSAEMRDALCEALAVAVCDASVREIVLRGEGPAFCSGGDLDEFGTLPDPATAHAIRSTRNAGRLLAACRERVRAEVHGACVGAGAELPAFAAHVVAREDAFFQLPEVAMGLIPGAGGTVSIPRRIGRQRTAWLALTGVRLDPETALDWGLVDELRA